MDIVSVLGSNVLHKDIYCSTSEFLESVCKFDNVVTCHVTMLILKPPTNVPLRNTQSLNRHTHTHIYIYIYIMSSVAVKHLNTLSMV